MSTPDPIEAYLKELRRRLRWRRGGRRMTEEVEDHLRELAADDEGRGLDPAEARRIAVAQVGPPSALLRRRWYVRPLAAASIGVTAVAVGVALFAHTSAHRAKATGLSPRLEAQEVAAYTKQVPPYLTSRTTLAIALGSGIPVYRPSCGLASDHTIVEIWRAASPGPEFAILYRSALVETIDPARYWGIRSGNAAAVLRRQARSWPNARFLRILGAPAIAVPSSGPLAWWRSSLAPLPPLSQYGVAATVILARGGTVVMLQRWGPDTLPSVIAAARSLSAGLPAPESASA